MNVIADIIRTVRIGVLALNECAGVSKFMGLDHVKILNVVVVTEV